VTRAEAQHDGKRGWPALQRIGRLAGLLAIAAFFAIMWGLLLRDHLRTQSAAQLRPNYDNLLKPGEEERNTAWGIYFGAVRIGHLSMKVARETDGTITVRTDAAISISQAARYIVGVAGNLDAGFQATISPLRGLMFFQIDSKLLNAAVQGSVRENEIYLIGHIGAERIRTSLPYNQDRLLGEALSPLTALPALKESQVGRSWDIDMVNPITGSVQKVTIAVAGSKRVILRGEKVTAFELTFVAGANRWASWVTEDGDVLVQGTPFGLTMQREDLPASVLSELIAIDAPPQPAVAQ
jgi:hypothetical protein